MEQQQHHGRVQDNQDQRAQHQAQHRQQGGQQEPSQRRNRVEAPERLFVTVMSNVTYKYIPRTFGILFITAGTLVLTYTFMNRILPRKAAWGMVGLFAGVCVFRLLGMICLFLDKNCEEKKAWSKRASRASIDLEGGLGSPSCPHRCADRVEGAWDWVKECFYQGLCFGFCFPCASKKKMKKRRDSRSQGSRSGGRELEGFFPKENEGFRRNGLGRRGARAEDSEAGGGRARRGGKTQHPRPRPSDLGSPRHPSELPTDHGSLRRPESKGNVQNSRSNQQKFHGSGASLQGRLDDPRSLYHYTVALSEPPPFSINHVKGMEAQTWWLTLAFATDKGVIPEPTIQPSATEDDESEEGRHEMLPEQTQAIQQESRLSEYESQTSNPALQIQIPEQMSSVMRPPVGYIDPNKYGNCTDLIDVPSRKSQEQHKDMSSRRTRTLRRQGTKYRSGYHQHHNPQRRTEERIACSAPVGYDTTPPQIHLNLHGHEKAGLLFSTDLKVSNEQNLTPEGRMDSPTLSPSLGTSSEPCDEQQNNDADIHEREMPPSQHGYPPFI